MPKNPLKSLLFKKSVVSCILKTLGMKKTIFTICSVITVCLVIVAACKKDDNGDHQVSYASQPHYGTGGNPNPNGNPTSTGAVATTTGTVAPTYGSFNDGTNHTFTASTACGSATMTGTYSGGTVILSFSAPPTAGTYTLVTSGAGPGQLVMTCFGGNCTAGGIVTVSGTTPVTATFTSVFFNTTNITGSLKCM